MLFRMAAILALSFSFFLGPAAMAGPNDIAIVIGNRDYQGNVPKVEFAQRDAEAFAKAARDVLGVKPGNVVPLTNLTFSGFRRWFGPEGAGTQNLSQLVTASDTTIYVFYSGHGLPAEIGGRALKVLLPSDADPQEAAQEGYAIEWIRKAVLKVLHEKAPKGRAVLFFDACFSGSSPAGTLVSKTSAVSIASSKIKEAALDRVTELAASSPDEVAYWDTDRRHGVFTDALLDGLYGKAADASGAVFSGALAEFMRGRTNERLAHLYPSERKRQSPTLLGDASTRLASLSVNRPHRNEVLAAEERTQCRVLPVSSDEKAIRDYLATCRECNCREALDQRLRQIARLAATCAAEERLLTALAARGSSARNELEALQKSAECEAVRNKAIERNAALSNALNVQQTTKSAPQTSITKYGCFEAPSDLPDEVLRACSQFLSRKTSQQLRERALNRRGLAHSRKQQFEQAIVDFNELITLNRSSAGYFDNRQAAHRALGHYDLALRDANEAVKLSPNRAFVFHARGGLLFDMGRFEDAASDFTRAYEQQDAFIWSIFDRGRAYAQLGRYEQAIRDFSLVIQKEPSSAYTFKERGMAYLQMREFSKARSDLALFLKAEPNDIDALAAVARTETEEQGGRNR